MTILSTSNKYGNRFIWLDFNRIPSFNNKIMDNSLRRIAIIISCTLFHCMSRWKLIQSWHSVAYTVVYFACIKIYAILFWRFSYIIFIVGYDIQSLVLGNCDNIQWVTYHMWNDLTLYHYLSRQFSL